MTGLQSLWREWQLWYYEWALKEMGGDHPDVPHVVRQINRLQWERV